tara:strand:- start:100 stop:897 length:798 start_codon:yes stop_codon:yes gene_type:complete
MPTAEYLEAVRKFKENCITERTTGQMKIAVKTEKLRRQEKNKRMTNTHIFNLFDNRLQPIRDFHVGSGGRSDQDRVRVPPFFVEGRNPIHVEEMGWEAGETVHEIPERNRQLYRDFGRDVMEINRREIAVGDDEEINRRDIAVGDDEEDQAERVLERLVDVTTNTTDVDTQVDFEDPRIAQLTGVNKALVARRKAENTEQSKIKQRIERLESMKRDDPMRGTGQRKRMRGDRGQQMVGEELSKLYTKLRESEAEAQQEQEQNVGE